MASGRFSDKPQTPAPSSAKQITVPQRKRRLSTPSKKARHAELRTPTYKKLLPLIVFRSPAVWGSICFKRQDSVLRQLKTLSYFSTRWSPAQRSAHNEIRGCLLSEQVKQKCFYNYHHVYTGGTFSWSLNSSEITPFKPVTPPFNEESVSLSSLTCATLS